MKLTGAFGARILSGSRYAGTPSATMSLCRAAVRFGDVVVLVALVGVSWRR